MAAQAAMRELNSAIGCARKRDYEELPSPGKIAAFARGEAVDLRLASRPDCARSLFDGKARHSA